MAHDQAYYAAEKKIEWARRSSATELDLRGMSLTELPQTIGELTYLKKLDLGVYYSQKLDLGVYYSRHGKDRHINKLTVLPESLGQLTQLQSLDLSENKLTVLPESLGLLTQLQSLDFSRNQLVALPESLGQLTQLQSLNLVNNQLTTLPDSLGQLAQLQVLDIGFNQLSGLPECLRQLTQLRNLRLSFNQLTTLPEGLGQLTKLQVLALNTNALRVLPEWIANLAHLRELYIYSNELIDLPLSLAKLDQLEELDVSLNPLNPELAAAYTQGLDAVKAYLRAKAAASITFDEAKLILVGEGEVGKSCLMDALQGAPWQEHDTTHGIEIKQIQATDPESQKEISLNVWDFGGQRAYRPTHQLFFSAPAVYLVVWKPREGPQQGFVKEWIRLIKHREPDAKILVVATHGGPQQRKPDIDRQELWDLFGKDTVIDFFFVDSKPDENGNRKGIDELKKAIASVAAKLPEMGRSVPKRWQDAREALQKNGGAYLTFERVLEICYELKMEEEEARLFVTIEHRLGHLSHYDHDPALRDIVVLKPDWLATAMSFVLDDEQTHANHGLVNFARLGQLWNDPKRDAENRYSANLHPIFLRLMERFDLSYRIAGLLPQGKSDETSLIAQLVPDNRPDPVRGWVDYPAVGNAEQVQICRIVDNKGQSATAEGLFYQLIVRLHRYSLGRENYNNSVHWQRGLVLDDDYNGRALLEYKNNDVQIAVRAPYPERFLAMLTSEVKYLVENFWQGLRCQVMVPCVNPCGKNESGTGLFEVEKLIAFRKQGMTLFPCVVSGCNQFQNIDTLLRNAPASHPFTIDALIADERIFDELRALRGLVIIQHNKTLGRFTNLDASAQRILSKVDDAYFGLMTALSDEAKEGPRLFDIEPVNRSKFDPFNWTTAKFRLTLWCEHSRQPLSLLNNPENQQGVYELELTREWFRKMAPLLQTITTTLSLVLPMTLPSIKAGMDEAEYKKIESRLDFTKSAIEATLKDSEKLGEWYAKNDKVSLERGKPIRAEGAALRELHALLKEKDPAGRYGNLVRVQNKRQEFLWVHPQFATEY